MDNNDFEKQFAALSEYEKNIVNTTALSIEEINHYKERLNRNLTQHELRIAGLLRNYGVVLSGNDFLPLLK
jgi:hypothetical protein